MGTHPVTPEPAAAWRIDRTLSSAWRCSGAGSPWDSRWPAAARDADPGRGGRRTLEGEAPLVAEVVMDVLLFALVALFSLVVVGLAASIRVVKQIERGVVFRLGRAQRAVRRPGPTMLIPFADRMRRGKKQGAALPRPPPDSITPHNRNARGGAGGFFPGVDP